MKKEIIYKTSKGSIEDIPDRNTLIILEDGMANYGGCSGKFVEEVRINYQTGLYQRWAVTGYQAWHEGEFEGDREKAIAYGKRLVS